jgi:filamentous hemagglutinin
MMHWLPRLPSDCGGHLIAAVFGGAGEAVNLVPMDRILNAPGGRWFELEREWRRAIDAGRDVSVDIRPVYPDGSRRPGLFEVEFSIDGVPQPPRQIFNTPTGLAE